MSHNPSTPPVAAGPNAPLSSKPAVPDDAAEVSDMDDDSSVLSESSEEPSDESSDEDDDDDLADAEDHNGITNVRANRGQKPIMRFNKDEMGPDIRIFLKEFLPQLKAANDELEAKKKAGTLKNMDSMEGVEDKDYIEMDLGLGVLEMKDDQDSGDEMDTEDGEKEKDILGKLMGREKTGKTTIVQEVDMQGS